MLPSGGFRREHVSLGAGGRISGGALARAGQCGADWILSEGAGRCSPVRRVRCSCSVAVRRVAGSFLGGVAFLCRLLCVSVANRSGVGGGRRGCFCAWRSLVWHASIPAVFLLRLCCSSRVSPANQSGRCDSVSLGWWRTFRIQADDRAMVCGVAAGFGGHLLACGLSLRLGEETKVSRELWLFSRSRSKNNEPLRRSLAAAELRVGLLRSRDRCGVSTAGAPGTFLPARSRCLSVSVTVGRGRSRLRRGGPLAVSGISDSQRYRGWLGRPGGCPALLIVRLVGGDAAAFLRGLRVALFGFARCRTAAFRCRVGAFSAASAVARVFAGEPAAGAAVGTGPSSGRPARVRWAGTGGTALRKLSWLGFSWESLSWPVPSVPLRVVALLRPRRRRSGSRSSVRVHPSAGRRKQPGVGLSRFPLGKCSVVALCGVATDQMA